MKIEALFREFDGLTTTHQREERLKTFIGQHIEIANCVRDIQNDGISLLNRYDSDLTTYDIPSYWNIHVSYDKHKCGDEFLTYSKGDEVALIAILESGSLAGSRRSLHLDCVSVVRVKTYQSRLQEAEAAIAAKREADRKAKDTSCFVATAVLDEPDSKSLLTLRRYRDEELRGIVFGRMAIAVYELLGPVLARAISCVPLIRKVVRRSVILPASRFAERRLKRPTSL